MDKLQSMLIFTTVTQKGGFTAAATKLNMSPSTVTKNVAALEQDLGVQLFNRTTRRVVLTDFGKEYYERCTDILSAIKSAEDAMRDRNSVLRGKVRMVMPFSFGRVTFVPELPNFFKRYPGIELDIHFSDEPVDIINEGFDLAVLVRDLNDSRLICRTLHRGPEVTVASPAYLDQHGRPETPEDLVHHRCIIGNFGDRWNFQTADGEMSTVNVKGAVTLHSGDAVLEAAVAGAGIAQSTWWLFRKELERGTLVPLLGDFSRVGFPISVVYPTRRLPTRTMSVVQFLTDITKSGSPQGRVNPRS